MSSLTLFTALKNQLKDLLKKFYTQFKQKRKLLKGLF